MDEPTIKKSIEDFMRAKDVPTSEFYANFVVDMVRAMMVSYHKYGLVAKAYPEKFDAMGDIRTRAANYRQSGDFWFLVDVANFAMIEAMHPQNELGHWGRNDDDTSPGRVSAETKQLVKKDNEGNRLGGDGFLNIPREV